MVARVQGEYETKLNGLLGTPAGKAYVAWQAADNIEFAKALTFSSGEGIPAVLGCASSPSSSWRAVGFVEAHSGHADPGRRSAPASSCRTRAVFPVTSAPTPGSSGDTGLSQRARSRVAGIRNLL